MRSLYLLGLILIAALAGCSVGSGIGETDKLEFKALQIKACCAAMKDFIATETGSDLSHFTVQVSEQDDSYKVVFIPGQVPGKPTVRGGRTEYGREVGYAISKRTWEITRKTFAR